MVGPFAKDGVRVGSQATGPLFAKTQLQKHGPPEAVGKSCSTHYSSNSELNKRQDSSRPVTRLAPSANAEECKEECSHFVDIKPDDTFRGYQVLKRGHVQLPSFLGPSRDRQLVLCGN